MISSSALPNFSWTVATPLNGASARANPLEVEANADSFQNIFANAAALPPWAPASPASSTSSNWTTQAATTDAEVPNGDSIESVQTSPSYSASAPSSEAAGGPANGESSAPNPSDVASGSAKINSRSPVRTSQGSAKQASTNVDKKVDQPGRPLHAERSGAVSGAVAVPTAPAHETAGANRPSAQTDAPDRNPSVQQTGTDSTEKTGSAAAGLAGGANILTGAAFALHVTPTTNHNPNQKAALAAGATQPLAAVATSPSDHPVPDPGTAMVGVADPTGLLASAALVANSGTARSSQVSAIGSSLGAANNTPWSASTSSPALLNDQAKPAESVTAAAPVAEVDVEDPTGSAQPVRTLQLQLGGTGDQRVDLRLVEHAGGLSVSVRASDSTLTRGLQDNLPELSSRLAAEHYQTQAWLPAAGQTSPGGHSSGSPEQSAGQSGDRGSGGQSSRGGSPPPGGQGSPQQGRQQDQTPAWWRQMATLSGASDSVSTSVPSSTPVSADTLVPSNNNLNSFKEK